MITTEVELCKAAIQWLQAQHWDVYQEVQLFYAGSRADIVAVRGPSIWIIEAKMSLSVSVIEQAYSWRYYGNYVSVLIPERQRRRSGISLLATLGLGFIELYRPTGDVHHHDMGRFMRVKDHLRERMIGALSPELQTGEYGEAGNAKGARWTPYASTMDQVRRFLKEGGPATIKQIIQNLEAHHYSSDKSALQSIRKALTTWEDWCAVDRSGKEHLYSVDQLVDKEK